MSRALAAVISVLVLATLVPSLAPPAQAADVSVNLYAAGTMWHVGSAASTSTTISVSVNDTLHLRIENTDSFMHTFTAPHFPRVTGQGGTGTTLNLTLNPGQVRFWNYTMLSSDAGSWQFYCSVPGHSIGTYPNRTGMVGVIAVSTPTAPSPGTDYTLLIGGIVIVIAIIAVVAVVLTRRKPKPPAQP